MTGQPTVRQQRDKWVVRVDTETGKQRPRQLGTYLLKRTAMAASRSIGVEDGAATRDTVGWLVRRYVASGTDVTLKAREQYSLGHPTHRKRPRRLRVPHPPSRHIHR